MRFNSLDTAVFKNLGAVTNYLGKNSHNTFVKDLKLVWPNVGENILLKHCTYPNQEYNPGQEYHVIRMWKTNMFTSLLTKDMEFANYIGGLDYRVNKDRFKLEYISTDIEEVRSSLINYAENNAREHNIDKLILDAHNNLKRYNEFYKKYDFFPNSKICTDNPFWIEVEKKI